MRRRRSLRGMAVGLLVASLIFFATGEILTRSFDMLDRLSPLPRGLFVPTEDPRLPYVLKPGATVRQLGVEVRVNDLGLRGPPVEPRGDDVLRILVLGDSVAFGHGLPVEEAFPAVLERLLEARTDRGVEVLNGGVQGYNTVAELAWFETRGVPLQPDAVVLAFNLNDYDRTPVLAEHGVLAGAHGVAKEKDGARRSRSLGQVSEFWFLLRWIVHTRGRVLFGATVPADRPTGNPWIPLDLQVSRVRKHYYETLPDERWRTMIAALRGIRDVTRGLGIPLLVAILPDGDQVAVSEPDLTPQRRIRGLCRMLGLDCIDLRHAFEKASDGREGALFLDIMHPNAAGHAVAADLIADVVQARLGG